MSTSSVPAPAPVSSSSSGEVVVAGVFARRPYVTGVFLPLPLAARGVLVRRRAVSAAAHVASGSSAGVVVVVVVVVAFFAALLVVAGVFPATTAAPLAPFDGVSARRSGVFFPPALFRMLFGGARRADDAGVFARASASAAAAAAVAA
jgi:hypothetical protein